MNLRLMESSEIESQQKLDVNQIYSCLQLLYLCKRSAHLAMWGNQATISASYKLLIDDPKVVMVGQQMQDEGTTRSFYYYHLR